MPITRPTGDQLLFESARTGPHILDAYLESAERGSKTLGALMAELFDTDGVLNNLVQLRINPLTREIEVRFGVFTDLSLGWRSTGVFSPRFMGPWAQNTEYRPGDYAIVSSSPAVCSVGHVSGVAPNTSNFYVLSGGTGGPATPGIQQVSTYDQAANGKCVVTNAADINVIPLQAETVICILNTSLFNSARLIQANGMQLFRGGTSGTGNRNVAPKGMATIYYETANVAIVNGNVS